jgi:hypothetical protein
MKIKNSKKIYFIYLHLLLNIFVCYSCGPPSMMLNRQHQNKGALLTEIVPGIFAKSWIERTVQLNAELSDSHTPGGFPGGMSFIKLNATLMDSSLVISGLKEFEILSEMDKEEIADYEKSYKQNYKISDYYFIWLEMQTTGTEEIFNLERWNIWCENNVGIQYNPAEIIESTMLHKPINPSVPSSLENKGTTDKKFESTPIPNKVILLYFAKSDINGNDIVDLNTGTLSLVLLDWNDRGIKYKGTWDLKSLSDLK